MEEAVESVGDKVQLSSHLNSLITKIESILASPSEFTSKTLEKTIIPILSLIQDAEYVADELYERIGCIRRWCTQLDDACRAAYARERINEFLTEIENWEDWQWQDTLSTIESKRTRIDDIKQELNELPIEWLKNRVTGVPQIQSKVC